MEENKYIIGADEVGTGSAISSIVVVAIRAPFNWNLQGLNDSKKLSPKKREIMRDKLFELISKQEIGYYLAERDNIHIDQVGLFKALKECYLECFQKLYISNDKIIVDGTLKFDNFPVEAIIKADSKIPTVMGASILAKTYRDAKVVELYNQYPNYNWNKNKGYLSKEHLAAIKQYGLTEYHRKSYKIKI